MGTKLETIEPQGGRYKLNALVCSWCSAILGVTSFYNTSTQIQGLDEKLDAVRKQTDRMQTLLSDIAFRLQR
jgi:hypothetical protein